MKFPPVPPQIVYFIFFIGFFIAFLFIFLILRKKEKINYEEIKEDVSFLIPAKNAQETIRKCIYSVINQDYSGKINIVVVNDGSTDNTEKIVREISKEIKNKKNRKIFLLCRESQGRKAFAVNYGLKFIFEKIKTPYIAILDADSFIHKNALKDMLPRLKEKTMCVISPISVYNRNNLLTKLQLIEYTMSYFFRELLGKIDSLCIAPAFSLFRTEFFLKYGIYDTNAITEDFEIALRIKAKGYKIAMSNFKVYTIVPEKLGSLRKQRIRWGYGEIYNFFKYKHLLFSGKHGMFGIFFMPIIFGLGLILIMLGFFIMVYLIISSLNNLIHYISIGWIPNLDLKINLFSLSLFFADLKIILIIISIIISSFFFIYAYKYRKEKINFLHFLIYMFVYSFFLAYLRFEGILRYILKIKTEW
ncbi:MAG: glycosyltransferase [Candidatus Pacearchaeota archaeon]